LAKGSEEVGEITGVKLLGYEGRLKWQQSSQALTIKLPAGKPCEHAYSFKIMFKK